MPIWKDKLVKLRDYLPPLGRLLLCGLFVWSGCGKLMDPTGTAQFLATEGVPAPGLAVWIAILVELVGGLALLVGFKTRWIAAILSAWCLATGFAVHLAAGIQATDAMVALDNMVLFYKNLGIAGGLLYVVTFGAGALSVDRGIRTT